MVVSSKAVMINPLTAADALCAETGWKCIPHQLDQCASFAQAFQLRSTAEASEQICTALQRITTNPNWLGERRTMHKSFPSPVCTYSWIGRRVHVELIEALGEGAPICIIFAVRSANGRGANKCPLTRVFAERDTRTTQRALVEVYAESPIKCTPAGNEVCAGDKRRNLLQYAPVCNLQVSARCSQWTFAGLPRLDMWCRMDARERRVHQRAISLSLPV